MAAALPCPHDGIARLDVNGIWLKERVLKIASRMEHPDLDRDRRRRDSICLGAAKQDCRKGKNEEEWEQGMEPRVVLFVPVDFREVPFAAINTKGRRK